MDNPLDRQFCADYSIPSLLSLSFDGSAGASRDQAASIDNGLGVPGYVVVTLGARYKLDLDDHSALLCLRFGNVINAYYFNVQSDGGVSPQAAGRAWAYLVVDL